MATRVAYDVHGFGRLSSDWMDEAACRDHDPEMWFYERRSLKDARSVCDSCPVMWDCRAYSLLIRLDSDTHYLYGFWGGLSQKDRQKEADAIILLAEALTKTVYFKPRKDRQ